MPITLQEIVNLPIFNTAKVRSGIEWLDHRHVEWMSTMEGPVENFVRKYELVLTTGLSYENNPTDFIQFIRYVNELTASALSISLVRYNYELNSAVIDIAEEKEFVIIELPWELRINDLKREVMKEINRRQESFVERAQYTQKQL